MSRKRLEQLEQIAALKRERDMARLNQLAAARTETQSKIDALARPLPLVTDPALFCARQAHLAWATAQRLRLNQTLALQTARMLDQKARTAQSFGRARTLEELIARMAQRRTHSP